MCEQHLHPEERSDGPGGPVAFVDELIVALTNARIYARAHPRVDAAVAALHTGLQALLRQTPDERVQIGATDGYVFYGGRPLLGASLSARRLLQILGDLGCGGISLESTTTTEDLHAFVRFVGRDAKETDRFDVANLALDAAGCRSVRLLPPYKEASGSWTDKIESEWTEAYTLDGTEAAVGMDLDIELPTRLYQDVSGALQDSMVEACSGNMLDAGTIRGHVESILSQLSHDTASLLRLSRYEKYDAFTFGHSIRVCFIALNFARHLTQDARLLERIGLAALMHDIGKAWVPFEVLHSTERLTDAERAEMNMHPIHGGQILLDSSDPDPLAVTVAFSHHQNTDGGGYPPSLRSAPPSAATMIIKLADVFEALTAVRPYKPRMSPTRAYRIMMDMRAAFDPALLRRFIEVNGIYPVGTRVKLSSGETARVRRITDSPLEPIVRTELAEDGGGLYREDVEELDLRERFGRNRISVVEGLLEAEM